MAVQRLMVVRLECLIHLAEQKVQYLGSLTADYWALHLQMENLMEIQHKFCAREEIERESSY